MHIYFAGISIFINSMIGFKQYSVNGQIQTTQFDYTSRNFKTTIQYAMLYEIKYVQKCNIYTIIQ